MEKVYNKLEKCPVKGGGKKTAYDLDKTGCGEYTNADTWTGGNQLRDGYSGVSMSLQTDGCLEAERGIPIVYTIKFKEGYQ